MKDGIAHGKGKPTLILKKPESVVKFEGVFNKGYHYGHGTITASGKGGLKNLHGNLKEDGKISILMEKVH